MRLAYSIRYLRIFFASLLCLSPYAAQQNGSKSRTLYASNA